MFYKNKRFTKSHSAHCSCLTKLKNTVKKFIFEKSYRLLENKFLQKNFTNILNLAAKQLQNPFSWLLLLFEKKRQNTKAKQIDNTLA